MKRLLFLLCVLMCGTFTTYAQFNFFSSQKKETKVYTPQISIRNVSGLKYAYYKGELYTGDVYSSDEKSKMTIKNGIAMVAYANYGRFSGDTWDNQFEIYEDYYTAMTRINNERANGTPGQKLAVELYGQTILSTLGSLPLCSFSLSK